MSVDIASANAPHTDRTPEHEANEHQAAAAGVPYPELTRTLRCTYAGIKYEMFAAIMSWSAPSDDCPGCDRCGFYLEIIAPNSLHAVPMATCACSSSYMTPVDDRDRALIELAHPVSEPGAKLGERFHSEIRRLTARQSGARVSVSIKTQPKQEGVKTREGTA